MNITAVRLETTGNDMVVSVETVNGWIEVIRESNTGPISHICEESGLRRANADAATAASYADLRASGGIDR